MIEPGDVVTALLPGVSETKRRPAVVISSPAYHAARPDVILALITGRVEKADTEFDCVLFDWEAAGLKLPSAMRSFVFTKPASRNEVFAVVEEKLNNAYVNDVVFSKIESNMNLFIDPFTPWSNPEELDKYFREIESGEVN